MVIYEYILLVAITYMYIVRYIYFGNHRSYWCCRFIFFINHKNLCRSLGILYYINYPNNKLAPIIYSDNSSRVCTHIHACIHLIRRINYLTYQKRIYWMRTNDIQFLQWSGYRDSESNLQKNEAIKCRNNNQHMLSINAYIFRRETKSSAFHNKKNLLLINSWSTKFNNSIQEAQKF